ncbi:MAG: preprotein translocase subunit SecE [Ardenticatenales bacterium]
MTEQLTDSEIRTSRLSQYLQDTRSELRKVVWPTRDQAINLTIVVLTVVVMMMVILFGIDTVFSQFFKLFLS